MSLSPVVEQGKIFRNCSRSVDVVGAASYGSLSIYFKTALHPVYTMQIYPGKLQKLVNICLY